MKTRNLFYHLATVMTLVTVLLLLQGTTNYTKSVETYAAIPLTEHTLGSGGKVTTPIGSGDDQGWDIAIQTDGKIVVAGNTYNGTDHDFAVVRYNSDGSLDTTFGSGGKVTTDFGDDDLGFGPGIAIQTDGKIVVVGGSRRPGTYYGVWAIARYNSDGSLDTTFDGDGKVTTDLGSSHDWAHAVAIQSDGKIVVAGERDNMVPCDFAVARYNSDGSLDTTFDGDGIVITNFGAGYDEVEDLVLQDDGKIILTGFVEVTSNHKDFALVRYNSDGSLDTTFDGDGKVITDFGGAYDYSHGATLQTDGKIVLAGFTNASDSNYDIAMARYNSDGSLDTAFGSGGKVTTDLGSTSNESARDVVCQPDGKIILAGYSGGDFVVLRYNSDGSLDTTFGSGGYVTTDFGSGDDYGGAVAVQTDGKIVVAGSAYNGTDYDFAVLRYNTDGSLDTTFSGVLDLAPTAAFTWSPQPQDEGSPVQLTDQSTSHPDQIVAWSWDFAGLGTSTAQNPRFTFMDDGLYTVCLTVTDDDGSTDTICHDVTVLNVAPSVDAGDDATIYEGDTFSGSGSFTDPGADTWTATVDYGNGSGTQPLALNPDKSFSLSHVYVDDGVYVVTVTVTDDDDGVGSDTTTVTVHNVAPAVDMSTVTPEPSDEGSAVTASATFSDPGVNDVPFTCTVNYGDGTGDLSGTISGNTCTGPDHVYADNGSYPVTVSVTDKDSDTGTSTAVFHVVNNVAPTVGPITAPLDPVEVNTEISVGADFTDPGVLDTHTAIWDWGDDTTSPGIVVETNGSGSVSGSHIYITSGVHTVKLTVTDDDEDSGESIFQYVVVYDPEGGFVTGGGWIDSPEGAYAPDPSLAGKATFGFVSKYKKGATVPTGQTQFQFRVADLNFHSDSYDWLVVAGHKAKYKGTGTINGAGNYGFMLTAIDAALTPSTDVDLFRIKIWDKDDNDTVVYDNQMGGEDDADPTTAIGGGNIVIHKGK